MTQEGAMDNKAVNNDLSLSESVKEQVLKELSLKRRHDKLMPSPAQLLQKAKILHERVKFLEAMSESVRQTMNIRLPDNIQERVVSTRKAPFCLAHTAPLPSRLHTAPPETQRGGVLGRVRDRELHTHTTPRVRTARSASERRDSTRSPGPATKPQHQASPTRQLTSRLDQGPPALEHVSSCDRVPQHDSVARSANEMNLTKDSNQESALWKVANDKLNNARQVGDKEWCVPARPTSSRADIHHNFPRNTSNKEGSMPTRPVSALAKLQQRAMRNIGEKSGTISMRPLYSSNIARSVRERGETLILRPTSARVALGQSKASADATKTPDTNRPEENTTISETHDVELSTEVPAHNAEASLPVYQSTHLRPKFAAQARKSRESNSTSGMKPKIQTTAEPLAISGRAGNTTAFSKTENSDSGTRAKVNRRIAQLPTNKITDPVGGRLVHLSKHGRQTSQQAQDSSKDSVSSMSLSCTDKKADTNDRANAPQISISQKHGQTVSTVGVFKPPFQDITSRYHADEGCSGAPEQGNIADGGGTQDNLHTPSITNSETQKEDGIPVCDCDNCDAQEQGCRGVEEFGDGVVKGDEDGLLLGEGGGCEEGSVHVQMSGRERGYVEAYVCAEALCAAAAEGEEERSWEGNVFSEDCVVDGPAGIVLDVDSSTLERAVLFMMGMHAGACQSGGVLYGMDQGSVVRLLFFADFLQCGELVDAAALALTNLMNFPTQGAPFNRCLDEVSQLLQLLPASISLAVCTRCPTYVGCELLVRGMHAEWWTVQMLEEQAAWMTTCFQFMEEVCADPMRDQRVGDVCNFLLQEGRESLCQRLLAGGVGSCLALRMQMNSCGEELWRGKAVRGMWGRVYKEYVSSEREREAQSDSFVSIAEPPLPECLESVGWEDPGNLQHTREHTDVLFNLVLWLRSVNGLISCVTSPQKVRGVSVLHRLPSAVTWLPMVRRKDADTQQDKALNTQSDNCAMEWPVGIKVGSLVVFGCAKAVPAVVGGILSCPALEGLRELDLEGCTSLTDSDVFVACARLPNLEVLDLKGAERISDSALMQVASSCTRLQVLQIGGCRGITDVGIEGFARLIGSDVERCRRLLKLSLMNCPALSNRSFVAVAEYLTEVRDLCIYGCYRITDDALIRIKRSSCLSRLNTSGCYKISDMGIRYLMNVRPTMLIYHKHRDFYKPLTTRDMK